MRIQPLCHISSGERRNKRRSRLRQQLTSHPPSIIGLVTPRSGADQSCSPVRGLIPRPDHVWSSTVDKGRRVTNMDLHISLSRFLESAPPGTMHEVASSLLELIEADAVEPLGLGRPVASEEIAERLETRLERVRRRDEQPEGLDVIEDAVAHLRAYDDLVAPMTFEDGEGIRWFVFASGEDVVACYTSAPFVEADV